LKDRPRPGGAVIRAMVPGDYDRFIAGVDTWWGGRRVHDQLPRIFADHFCTTSFVAEDDDRLVAFLVGFMSPADPAVAYIHFVGVRPERRRAGLGRQLYERFFTLALEHGRTEVRCLTSPVNGSSIAYHRALGFQVQPSADLLEGVPVHLDHDGPGEHRVLFKRSIAQDPETRVA